MTGSPLELEYFSVLAPDDWDDLTDEVRENAQDGTPYTLGRAGGVGALQFSLGLFAGGKLPEPSISDLREMLHEATAKYGALPDDLHEASSLDLLIAWTDLSIDDSFVRMWYLSDHLNFAKVTYICGKEDLGPELNEATEIVSTIRFQIP